MKFRSIKHKFLTSILTGTLVIAIIVGTCAYVMTNKLLHEKAGMLLDARCTSEAAHVNDVLCDIQQSVEVMAWYCQEELESPQALSDPGYLASYTTRMLEMHTIIAQHTDRVAAYYLRLAPELSSPVAGFFINRSEDGSSFVYAPPTDLSAYSPAETGHVGWYYEPVNAGQAVWLPPYLNLNNGIHMVSYVIPLYAEDVCFGVVGMDIDYTMLQREVDSISLYDNGLAYLTDAQGEVIHARVDEIEHGSCVESTSPLINGMRLVLHADYQDIIRESDSILLNSLVVFIVLMILFTLFVIGITSRITTPLQRLTAAVQQIEKGQKDVAIDCSGNDEIGVLSRAFRDAADQLQNRMSSISEMAYVDSLTRVKSRLAYATAAERLEKQIHDGSPEFGLIMLDSNCLKIINDRFGHEAGNVFIKHIASLICNVFKHSPVYRVGGDEFVVLLEGQDLAAHEQLLQLLDERLAAAPLTFEGVEQPSVVAHGTAIYDPARDASINDVFVRADLNMYAHKRFLKGQPASEDPQS